MFVLLVNQGGAVDIRRGPAWAIRGFAFLMFLLFFFIESARPRLSGLPLPNNRQKIIFTSYSIFTAFLIFNVLVATSTMDAIAEALGFLSILVVMLLASFYALSKERINYILHIVVAMGLFASIHGLLVYFKNSASEPLDSFFEWHNPAGGYFTPILIIFLAWLFTNSPRSAIGRYGWIGSIILAAALVFTLSRGAWLSFSLGFIVLLILLGIKRAFSKTGALSFAGIIVLVLILVVAIGGRSFLEPVYHRIISFGAVKDFSVEGRYNFYSGAIEIFKTFFLTGCGLGSFGYIYPHYQMDPRFFAKDPHSFYLRLISEGGIFGLVVLVMLFICFIHVVKLFFKNRDRQISGILCGMIAALVAGALHLAIDFDDTFPIILLNLGLIWVCVLNLLQPTKVELTATPTDQKKEQKKKAEMAFRSVAIVLIFFVLIFYSALMYLSESNYDLGRMYSSSDQWDKAEKSYDTALDYYPMHDRALLERTRTLLFMHDEIVMPEFKETSESRLILEKAVVQSDRLKKLAPYRATAYFLSGLASIRLDDFEKHVEATNDFKKALEIDPMNSPDFFLNAARAYIDIGDMNSFKTIYTRFMNTYPFERVEEFARTRLEWENLPAIYQDMIFLQIEYLKIHQNYLKAIDELSRMLELEKVREKILGEKYKPRKELLDYVDEQTALIEKETLSEEPVDTLIDEMSKF